MDLLDDHVSPAKAPAIRDEQHEAKSDLDRYGLTRISGLISDAEVKAARESLVDLAEAERAEAVALFTGSGSDNPNQRLYGLIHKAPIWRKLAINSKIIDLAHHVLGERVVLHAMQAHIVNPGGDMVLHFDQQDLAPQPPFPVIATAIVMLDDYTEENGATLVIPGSHKMADPSGNALDNAVAATGAAGTVLFINGLLWHGTTKNRSPKPRHGLLIHFALPWIRSYENYQRTITSAQVKRYPEKLRALLGIHEEEIAIGGGVSTNPKHGFFW